MSKVKGGMSPGMLRARRRDVNLKPNRVLDKGSSRGMIYENEELRLRTINITSEIERGQSELKKLKRENDHLRREIWALRDEVDRLEALLKQKEQEEEEAEEEDEEENDDDEGGEEKDEGDPGGGSSKESSHQHQQKHLRLPKVAAEPDGLSMVPEESEEGTSPEPSPAPTHQVCLNVERRLEEYKGVLPPCIRLNCVHPYTTAATIKDTPLANITDKTAVWGTDDISGPEKQKAVLEVVEAVGERCPGLVGVRLLEDSLYISWRGRAELEAAVASGLGVRGHRLALHDVSQGTVVLALSGVPHGIREAELVRLLSQFGPVIGGVERRLYRGTDTGEGLVRIRPLAALPRRIYMEGAQINVRPLCHEELSKLSMEQHDVKPRPPPLNIRLEERCASAPIGQSRTPDHGSAASLRPHSDSEATKHQRSGTTKSRRRGKSPSSSSEQESPAAVGKSAARRRTSLVPPIISDRERSNSLSSRTSYPKRKMSATGRESGKLPWCACWGNGCY